MTPKALIWTIVAVALAIAIPLGAYAAGGSGAQSDDTATSSPATKTLTDNGDGTYDLAINVTGKSSSTSEQSVKPVDIVLVLDVSGSMDEDITSYSYSPISGSPSRRNTYYVRASDGSYVSVKWEDGWFSSGTWQDRYGNTYDPSTTQFYSRSESTTSKLNALKSAVDGFLDATAKTNANITDENSKIRVSIVKFAGEKSNQVGNDTYGQNEYNNSQIVNNLTSDMSALKSSVRALRAGGTTSADYGMKLASSELSHARADADTYVIFFTDGEPNHYKGFDDTVANNAISTSQTLKSSGTTVYSIGVLSGADPFADPTSWNTSKANKYLQAMSSNYPNATGYTSLGSGDYTSGYYKAASSSEELSSIFDDIFSNISSTTTISNVSLTDYLTSMTATSLVNGEAGNFTYTKTENGNTTKLTGFPAASYQNGTITWNLGNTVLENGVTYTVHAKVWPSQTALDLVADLNNGTKSYDSLTDAEKAQLKQNSDGTYTLYTNPDSGNTVTYTEVTTKTSSHQPSGTVNSDSTVTGDDGYTYTKNADGTWTGTKADTASTTSNITNPTNGMAVSNQQVSFEKIWEGGTTTQTLLTAELQRDYSDYVSVTVTSDHNWTTTTNVAMGIIDGSGTALESGHDYTVVEPSYTDYHFEYSGETYRPMLIKNVPTVLVKIAGQEDGAYQIADSWYKPAAATSTLTATNIRKSTLNLSKSVVDNSANSDVPADALFTFTASVTDSKASDGNVWFSIVDASGKTVKDADRVSGATAERSDTGYYYAASGSTITLKLKASDNVRFINVSTGATYSFAETAMDKGFSFTSAAATVDNETASASEGTVSDQTVSGMVSQANKTYQVAFTDTYDATAPQYFTATKTVSGYDWNKSADIQISATGDNADCVKIPTSIQSVSNTKNGESQKVTFSGVEFLAEGTYTLNVKETTTSDAKGWTYDNSDHAITVRVAKGKDGKLAVTKVEGDNPTITNAYKADSVTVNTSTDGFFSKSVGTGNNNGSYTFNFTVEPQNGAPSPEKTTASVTYDANQTGKKAVDFGSITFDAAGTYNYKVTETTPSDGWTTPNAKATVTVTVSDDGSGQLTAAVAGSSITNNYGTDNVTVNTAAEGSAFLIKNFDVQSGTPADKKFDFTLTKCDAQGNVADGATPLSGSVTYTKGQAETSAVVDFGTLTFTQEGTYYYKAQETTENGDGWTKSSDEPIVKIVVTNDGEGHLVAEVSGTGTITNTYKADHIEVDTKDTSTGAFLTKAYNVHSGLTPNDAKFDFSIAEVDADGNPVEDGYTNTGSADYTKGQTETTAVVDLGQISYTTEGTHYYKVSETSADSNGWTKAENSDFTVKVTVTDNGKGQLVATVSGTGSIANAYSVTPVVSDPPVTKVVEGNPSKDATFSFTLTPDNPAYPMPTGTENGVKTTSITGSSSSEFGEISFTAPGTYTYTVAEVQGNAGGYTYDTNTHSIKYTVTDNGDGTLSVVRSIDGVEGAADSAVSFTNMYKDAPTTVDTDAEGSAFLTKAYDVADGLMPANKDFSFSITEVDADGNAVEGGYTNTGSADYAAGETSEAVDLGTITYDEPGTHYYKVTEATPDGGWTKSGDGYVVTVTVTDNGDGTLKAAVSGNGTITNTYKASNTTVDTDAEGSAFLTKAYDVADGLMPANKDFSFSITEVDADGNAVEGGYTNTGSADYAAGETSEAVDLGTITYDEPGTHYYKVTEATPDGGWTKSGDGYVVTVTVTDNGDGTLKAAVSGNGTITNTYKASNTTVDTDAEGSAFLTKAYDVAGELMPANKNFSFSITEVDADGNAVEGGYTNTGSADYAAGETSEAVDLGTITYDEPGTHYYKVTEATPDGGWTKSGDGYVVTVTVTDNGDGTLKAAVSGNGTITNTYKTTSTQLDASTGFAQKNVTSPNPTKDATFSFTLAGKDGAPMPANADGSDASSASVSYEAGESGTKNIDFGSITYTEPGTYSYTVTESTPASGWTATTSSANVNVTVKDNGDGTMSASVDTPATITNSYQAAATDSVTIKATKSLTGAPLMAGEFSFTLTGNNGAPMPSQTKAANVGDGSITFGPITYTEAGTYTYTVAEVNDGKSGFTYDTESKTVTVTVTDDGAGQLVAKVSGAPVFANSYVAESGKPLTLTAKKVLEGRALKEDQFSFQLFDESGNAVGEPVANDASGSITFPELNYTQQDFEGNGVEAGDNGTRTKTVTYTAKEVVPDEKAAGYTYSDNVAKYTVKLVDDGAGNITATLESSDSTTFTNTYKASPVTAEAFKATKELTGRTINAGEFKFQLTDEAGNVVEPVSNAADGTVTFSPITYKLSDLNNAESKTFKYTISEVGNDLGGVTYDTAKHTVSVTVTDNGDGTLTASKPVYDGNSETAPTFTNTYQAAPEVVPLPTVTKTVAGDQTDTYPTFSFVIEAQDGAPSLDNADGSSVTKTLDGPGSVDFGSVTFSAAGKYTYKIYEVAGDSDGWTYDGNVYTLTYTVTDNGNGRFDAVPTITNSNGETVDAVSFENTYTKPVVPEPAKPAPKVPDTGDTTSTALPVGLACIAVVAIAAGFIIKRKSNGSK